MRIPPKASIFTFHKTSVSLFTALALASNGTACPEDIVFGTFMAGNSHGSGESTLMTGVAPLTGEYTNAFQFLVPPGIDYEFSRLEIAMRPDVSSIGPYYYGFELFADVGNAPPAAGPGGAIALTRTESVRMSSFGEPELVIAYPENVVTLEGGKAYWIRASLGGCWEPSSGQPCIVAEGYWMMNSAGVTGSVADGQFQPYFDDASFLASWSVSQKPLPAFRIFGEPAAPHTNKPAYSSYASTGPSTTDVEVTLYPEVFCPVEDSHFWLEVSAAIPAGSSSADVCQLLASQINSAATCIPGLSPCPPLPNFGFSATCAGNVLRVANGYTGLPCGSSGFVCADRADNLDSFRRSMSSELQSVEGRLKLRLIGVASGIVDDPSYGNSLRVVHTRRCAGGTELQSFDVEIPLAPGMVPSAIVNAAASALGNLGDPDISVDGDKLVIDAPTDCPTTTQLISNLDSSGTTSGSAAFGTADFQVDTQNNTLEYTVNIFGLEGAITAMHIHGPIAGLNGPIAFVLPNSTMVAGSLSYPESLESAILGGAMYVDVHTGVHPTGEIRGRIALVTGLPVPNTPSYDLAIKINDEGFGFSLSPLGTLFEQVTGSASSGASFCFGDGSGMSCPCLNIGGTGEGCQNSAGTGASLIGTGLPSLSVDTLRLTASGAPQGVPGILLRGVNQTPAPAGDGIFCLAGPGVFRSHVQFTDGAGSTTFASFNDGTLGSVAQMGAPTNFQYWFREPFGICGTTQKFNFSNGWSVTYIP